MPPSQLGVHCRDFCNCPSVGEVSVGLNGSSIHASCKVAVCSCTCFRLQLQEPASLNSATKKRSVSVRRWQARVCVPQPQQTMTPALGVPRVLPACSYCLAVKKCRRFYSKCAARSRRRRLRRSSKLRTRLLPGANCRNFCRSISTRGSCRTWKR